MRIKTRIYWSIVASVVVSAVLGFLAVSAVRGIEGDLTRHRHYEKIIQETFALNLLVAAFDQESGRREMQQLGEVRRSLTRLLAGLSSSDVSEKSLIRQIQKNNQELGPLLDQFFALRTEQVNPLRAELRGMLSAQVETKARFISDDTYRLMEISESRVGSGYARIGITFLVFLAALIAANVVISLISGRSIVRMERGLQESEEKFRGAFANTAIGLTMMRPDGRFVDANPAFCLLTGYQVEELRTMSFQQLVHPEDLSEYMGLIDRMLAGAFNSFVVENRYLPKDGTPVWVRKSVSLVRNPDGLPQWIIVLIENIADRKRAEEALQKAHIALQDHARRLAETNRELEGFAYTVSHDLRAPLRAINGFAHMLEDDYGPSLDEEGKRRLAVIEANAVKMGQQIDDLLAFSRAGRTAMKISRIDMNGLVADILETLKTSESGAKADLRVAGLPPAQGDPALIRQVLANLLENAVKFSRKRQNPGIEVGSLERDGERVYFVKDNGIGFDAKYHNKVFGVFQRLVTEKEFEGTGVGLAIVQRLVARHGGRVWAESSPGEGATFFFTLNRSGQEVRSAE